MIRLWVDDVRTPPGPDWVWVGTPAAAIWTLQNHQVSHMSLDHDLGIDVMSDDMADLTTREVVLWMIEHNTWPDTVVVHSANPVGRDWLEEMIKRYKPERTEG